ALLAALLVAPESFLRNPKSGRCSLAVTYLRTGMRTRARLLKQNENRRDGAATGPWSYLVVRSCGSGRARPPRSRRARCAEDAGCRQRSSSSRVAARAIWHHRAMLEAGA